MRYKGSARTFPNKALTLLLTWLAMGASPALHAQDKSPSAKWEKEIQAFERADKQSPPPEGAILFIGSSSTRLWKTLAEDFPEYKVINRGFGGSEIADSGHFAERIVIPYRPRLIVLQAGTNDIAHGKTPEQIAADFKTFVEKVRAKLPDTRIAYLSINPAPVRFNQMEKQREANRLIQEFVRAGKNLDYINLWEQFLDAQGKPREEFFMPDRLHNNEKGYKIRADAVRPHLK